MSAQDQVKVEHFTKFSSLLETSPFRLHQTENELEIVFSRDVKHGLGDAIFHSFEGVSEEIERRTDKIAGDAKNVR